MKNENLIEHTKKELKKGLALCNAEQQMMFRHMYSQDDLDLPMDKAVEKVPTDRLEWALTQIQKTVVKNEERYNDKG